MSVIHKKSNCLLYTSGESIEFSPASSYHVNFKDVTGLSDVRNAIYSTNSMGPVSYTHLFSDFPPFLLSIFD